jgi:small subunit ribosomal protein S1
VEVTSIGPTEVEVKLADGRPGVIARSDFVEEPVPSVGDRVEVAMLARDDPKKRVVASRAWARSLRGWEALELAAAQRSPISGTVTKVVKGGLIVDVGVRCFLPGSMVDDHRIEDLSGFLGQTVEALVHELNRAGDRAVLNRRELLRRQRRDIEREALNNLQVGAVMTGVIAEVVNYGVYVDLKGIRGLVHVSEIAWDRGTTPNALGEVGDEVQVKVIDIQRAKRRVALSVRQLGEDPFASIPIKAVVPGTVVKVLEHGLVVRLNDHPVSGLVHTRELSDFPGMRPDQVAVVGESVWVKVLSVDSASRRVSLSLRQAMMG